MPAQPKRVKITEQEVTGDHRDSARELVQIERRPSQEHQMPKGTTTEKAE
jgi:hypothetical protein